MDKKNLFLLLIAALFFAACNNFSKTESGLRFKFLKRSEKQNLPVLGQYLQCYYSIVNSEDSLVYSNFGRTPSRVELKEIKHLGGDFMEALSMMAEGDSAQFLISADSFYLINRFEQLPSFIEPGSDLKFTIKMDRFLTRFQAESLANLEKIARWNEEIVNINNYVRKNNLVVQLDTLTGIRMQFYQKGSDTAKQVVEGSTVTLHLIGKLMDGTEFYNSYTAGHPETVKVSKVEPIGMYEMLVKMRKGDKATFILPYDLAYGSIGKDDVIPPYSTLIYELNILNVQ